MTTNFKEALNTQSTLTITLASLAASATAGRQSTLVDNRTNLFQGAQIMVKFKTGASGVSATGTVVIYAIGSMDGGTTVTDGGGASDAALTRVNAIPIATMNCTANATTYIGGPYEVGPSFGGELPGEWGILLVNNTGSTSDTTAGNFSVQYQEFYTTGA
jgi:hypothetical protein